jgi:hypothetical protein
VTLSAIRTPTPGIFDPGLVTLDCLERVQKRAVKMVSGLRETEYSMRLKELGLATLEERRHRADMQMVHKIMHGESGLEPGTWFERAGDEVHATRSGADPLNIKNKTGRLEIRKNFFSMRVISDWNRIPAEIKQRAGAASFKAAYKHLRENPAHPV